MPGGGPMTADYARRRAAHEPVVEVTQIKGDSEAHPFLSPNDEFAGFGVAGWELGNLPLTRRTTPDMFGGNYVREALKRGLTIEARTGVNPYRFGLIGSTDSHTALATADEDNFFGKHTGNEPNATRAPSRRTWAPAPGTVRLALPRRRLRCGMGQGQHPRGDLRRADAARGLCHHRAADDRADVRRVGFHRGGLAGRLGPGRLHPRRADGRRARRQRQARRRS